MKSTHSKTSRFATLDCLQIPAALTDSGHVNWHFSRISGSPIQVGDLSDMFWQELEASIGSLTVYIKPQILLPITLYNYGSTDADVVTGDLLWCNTTEPTVAQTRRDHVTFRDPCVGVWAWRTHSSFQDSLTMFFVFDNTFIDLKSERALELKGTRKSFRFFCTNDAPILKCPLWEITTASCIVLS